MGYPTEVDICTVVNVIDVLYCLKNNRQKNSLNKKPTKVGMFSERYFEPCFQNVILNHFQYLGDEQILGLSLLLYVK